MPSGLSPDFTPETLYETSDHQIVLQKCPLGLALFHGERMVYKDWGDSPEPVPDGMLFMRKGTILLRNAFGQIWSPEPRLDDKERQLLAKIFLSRPTDL